MSRIKGVLVPTVIFAIFVHLALGQAAEPERLPRLRVSDNRRFLVTEEGKPLFYLADTAWELFHRLDREQADKYLTDRAGKDFNVIQAVALAELDGLTVPNVYGHNSIWQMYAPGRKPILNAKSYWYDAI